MYGYQWRYLGTRMSNRNDCFRKLLYILRVWFEVL